MSKPVYEIPIGDGEYYPPASSRRSAVQAERAQVHPDFAQQGTPAPAAPAADPFAGFPPPSAANAGPSAADLGAAPGYQSAPPPTGLPSTPAPDMPAPPVSSRAAAAPTATDTGTQVYELPTYDAARPAFPAPAAPSFQDAPPPAFAAPAPTAAPTFDAPPPAFGSAAPTFDAPPPAFAAPAPPAAAAPAAPAAQPAPATDSFSTMPPPVVPAFEIPVTTPAPAAAEAEEKALPAFLAPPAPSHRLDAEPVAKTSHAAPPADDTKLRLSDRAPQVGEGQEGSDPDLVAALNQVVLLGASDLHVSVNAAPMVRVDGGLRPVEGFDIWDADKVNAALQSIMAPHHREIFEAELELDFAYTLSETARFRVNFYQQRNVFGAAFRLIPTQIKQLAALGVPDTIGNFAQLPRGLVLVTGPTGSGKSTTLAALIDLVNSTRADHIVTVEDPIEFMHENKKSLVNQREVGHDTHSFANALKHVLRQDPDVILIGELRDLETISVALTAAETGHLVFATLHTQDAPQTIDRVIDVFPPHQQGQVRAQLAATLQGVVCQTLVKKAHGGGRAVATEVLITTSAVANLIREGKTYQIHSAMQAGRELGMHTMDQHLADLVNAGRITHAAAYEKAHNLEDLKTLIQRAGGDAPVSANGGGIDFGDAFSKGA